MQTFGLSGKLRAASCKKKPIGDILALCVSACREFLTVQGLNTELPLLAACSLKLGASYKLPLLAACRLKLGSSSKLPSLAACRLKLGSSSKLPSLAACRLKLAA
ncbi:hypothetical protein [Pseudomonas putida]